MASQRSESLKSDVDRAHFITYAIIIVILNTKSLFDNLNNYENNIFDTILVNEEKFLFQEK